MIDLNTVGVEEIFKDFVITVDFSCGDDGIGLIAPILTVNMRIK